MSHQSEKVTEEKKFIELLYSKVLSNLHNTHFAYIQYLAKELLKAKAERIDGSSLLLLYCYSISFELKIVSLNADHLVFLAHYIWDKKLTYEEKSKFEKFAEDINQELSKILVDKVITEVVAMTILSHFF